MSCQCGRMTKMLIYVNVSSEKFSTLSWLMWRIMQFTLDIPKTSKTIWLNDSTVLLKKQNWYVMIYPLKRYVHSARSPHPNFRDMISWCMMTSSNGYIFRVSGHLCREFTGHQCLPHTKASDPELWYFFICSQIHGWVNNREAGDLRPRPRYTLWSHLDKCGVIQYVVS